MNKKELDKAELNELIRPHPNYKTMGVKIRLMAYNSIDSIKILQKRLQKNEEIRLKNKILIEKQHRINNKRIEKAQQHNKEWYTQKIIPLKDTVDPSLFFREWMKYKFGEPPVVFDSLYYQKSLEQLNLFIKKKGFYYSNVCGNVTYKSNKKAIVTYSINLKDRYFIDTVEYQSANQSIIHSYQKGIQTGDIVALFGQPLDTDMLNKHRMETAEWLRNDAFYGFNFSNVNYQVDTTLGDFKAKITIIFSERVLQTPDYPDSSLHINHQTYHINDVFFHIIDTSMMKGRYAERLKNHKLISPSINGEISLLDTLVYQQIFLTKSEKKRKGIDPRLPTLNQLRIAHFYYNGKLFVRPEIIEMQNYLEHSNHYKQLYFDRSYTRLLQTDLFSSIRPQLIELPDKKMLDVHYYLTPAPRQYMSIEPKATNSNGFLGVSASLNYSNRNLFRGAEKFTFALGGGFESEPPIFDTSMDGEKIIATHRSLNTFEFEPSIKLDFPGLFPIRRVTHMTKRQRARTILLSSWNFQNRSDFKRRSLQFGYMLRFYGGETQAFNIGLPLLSVIKFVNIDPSAGFQEKINDLNDVFLKNTYSDQFIWQDVKVVYEYNTTERKNNIKKSGIYYKLSFDAAGNLLSLFQHQQDTNAIGQRTFFKLAYSQFARIDNDIVFAHPFTKKHSIHARFLIGVGVPYGNTTTSLPYDYGFFGGGANDNRGWKARSLGPGGYKSYLDTNRTAIQVGDIRLAGFAEYRFDLGGYFKGAIFTDIGNVWTWNNDLNRANAQFSEHWYKQLAFSAGLGIRMDFGFVVGRVDVGIPLKNPALPNGSQWIFQSRRNLNQEIDDLPSIDRSKIPKPFRPQPFIAIGYPF